MNDRETNDRFRKEDRRDMVPAAVLSGCVHVILFVGLFSVFQWTTDSETVYAELWAPEPVSGGNDPKGVAVKPPEAPEPKPNEIDEQRESQEAQEAAEREAAAQQARMQEEAAQREAQRQEALAAAEHAQGEQHRKDRADDIRRAALDIEAEAAERILQVVGREHIKAHDIGQDQHDREHDAEPALVQRLLHIVRRAAVAAAVSIALFVDLRERRLDKCARTADQRHDPHPEHGAEAAETDGRGHADDVARADARRRGHHERTEGRNAALLFRLFLDNADRLTEQPELDQPGADREIQTRGEQKQRHDVRPVQKTADRIDNSVN